MIYFLNIMLTWKIVRTSKVSILYIYDNDEFKFKLDFYSKKSLSWTYQRDKVSLLVKFRLNKNNFILKK